MKKIERTMLSFLLVTIWLVVTGCSVVTGVAPGGKVIKTKEAALYRPAGMTDQARELIYVIMPGEDPGPYLKLWRDIADRRQALVAVPLNWDDERLGAVLDKLVDEYSVERVIITGLSNGGYNACAYGLSHPDQIAAIIPMAAYCQDNDIVSTLPRPVPILVVAGEKDTWALGDDGQSIQWANEGLVKKGLAPETFIVPGLGHALPVGNMDTVETWLKKTFP